MGEGEGGLAYCSRMRLKQVKHRLPKSGQCSCRVWDIFNLVMEVAAFLSGERTKSKALIFPEARTLTNDWNERRPRPDMRESQA